MNACSRWSSEVIGTCGSLLRERLAAVAASAVSAAVACGCCAFPAVARAAAAARLSHSSFSIDSHPLTRAGRWLVDDQGRVAVMHGVNLVQKSSPFYTSNIDEQDARFLADEGFTAAREGVIWEGLEPNPGHYDTNYVGHLAALNDVLGRYGIRTLLDMHQDAYSAYATPGIGDGAPAWADLGASMSDDFQAFWDNAPAPDGTPIQAHFVGGLQRLARSPLGTSTNVLGYDPFNEPYAGTKSPCAVFQPCPSFEAGALADFYRRAIAGIRSVDSRHLIFPEGIAQNGQSEPALPRFADPLTAFNFHYYCTATQANPMANDAEAAYCTHDEAAGLGNFEKYADALGIPAILSEFGASAPTDDLERVVLAAGEKFISWTQWAYENDFNDSSAPFSQSNAAQGELDAIVVPYPQAIAGTPVRWSFDYSTDTMLLTYSATAVPGAHLRPGALTRIFVPERKYPTGYTVRVNGARVASAPGAPWIQLAARPGSQVSVTLQPRAGSYTLTPLQANALPLATAARCPGLRTVAIKVPRARGRIRKILVLVNGRRTKVLRPNSRTVRLRISATATTTVRIISIAAAARSLLQRRFPPVICRGPASW